jgi:hypothetical protein
VHRSRRPVGPETLNEFALVSSSAVAATFTPRAVCGQAVHRAKMHRIEVVRCAANPRDHVGVCGSVTHSDGVQDAPDRKMRTTLARAAFAVGTLGGILVACGGAVGTGSPLAAAVGGAVCPELKGGAMNATFDEDARANATIRAFVTASGDLAETAARVQADVVAACDRMATDLGIAERRGTDSCAAVAARIDAAMKQGVSAQLRADITPPQCHVNAQAEAACKGQCNAQVDPGNVKATCAPGHLYGRCSGTCTGTCNGACNGRCEGQTGAGGECRGTCRGTCSGDCKGSCSVDFQEPKCDLQARPPSADARCDGSCRAHADLTAQCTEPRVKMQGNVDVGELPKIAATLERNLPALIKAQIAYGDRIADDVQILVRTGAELPSAFGHLSSRAAACVAAAANATASAQASLRVSVQASASVTAKAGMGGRTQL